MDIFSDYLESYLPYLPILLIVVSLYWTRIVGAPWVPTSLKMVCRMLELADLQPDDLVYDLGCGDGRLVITAALRYKVKAVGIEIDPLRYLWCQFLVSILFQRKNVRIIFGNIYHQNYSEANVVMCYLLPEALKRLEDKFRRELPLQARVISNRYRFPSLECVREDGEITLYRPHVGKDLRIP
jgi:SAM-dependent methyltransferase